MRPGSGLLPPQTRPLRHGPAIREALFGGDTAAGAFGNDGRATRLRLFRQSL